MTVIQNFSRPKPNRTWLSNTNPRNKLGAGVCLYRTDMKQVTPFPGTHDSWRHRSALLTLEHPIAIFCAIKWNSSEAAVVSCLSSPYFSFRYCSPKYDLKTFIFFPSLDVYSALNLTEMATISIGDLCWLCWRSSLASARDCAQSPYTRDERAGGFPCMPYA